MEKVFEDVVAFDHAGESFGNISHELWDGTNTDQIIDSLILRGYLTVDEQEKIHYDERLIEDFPEVAAALDAIHKAETEQIISDLIDSGHLEMLMVDGEAVYRMTEEGKKYADGLMGTSTG